LPFPVSPSDRRKHLVEHLRAASNREVVIFISENVTLSQKTELA
jgi:hypothetical protein